MPLWLWPAYTRSLLLRVQIIRIELRRLRALGALTAAKASGDPAPFLKSAAREARSLDAERIPGASAHARLIRAQAAAATGDLRAPGRCSRLRSVITQLWACRSSPSPPVAASVGCSAATMGARWSPRPTAG